jgi:signal transduction histidine kinase
MNQHLQKLKELIEQVDTLSAEEKAALAKTVKDIDSDLTITEFKLDRTEKVKRTTAILLEETIEELEQKRKAVEAQNRELEVESALERVRSVAMGMNKPEDLSGICETMFVELKKLGFNELRNAMIDIHYEEKQYLLNYDYSENAGKTVTTFVYNSHPIVDNLVHRAKQSKDAFTEMVYSGKALDELRAFRKQNGEMDDARLDNVEGLYYYFYSTGTGAVGISSYKGADQEQLDVLKRFRNVFDLAYQRYIDITNAEMQAHEARIQTALERVRAVAMAMRKSEELISVCRVMYEELMALGVSNIRNAQIAIKSKDTLSYLICSYSDTEEVTLEEAPYTSSPIVKDLFDELESSEDAFYQREFSGQQFDAWRKWRESLSPVPEIQAKGVTSLCFYLYSTGSGHLGMSSYDPIRPDQVELLKRFKNVFELSYKRYEDVSQAETQAREAHVQLALERVRARTMAMQRSEELSETVFVLFQQFKELGESPDQATIGIFNEAERVIEYWVTMHGSQNNKVYKFSIDEPNVTARIYDAWKAQKSSLVIDLSGQQLLDFMAYRASMGGAPVNPDEKRRIINVAIFSKGLINVQSTVERSDESVKLLERFAQVFEQTYTRFLDLQKAEAQAREAQIEAALERVRSRSMGMQKSNELKEVVRIVYEQFVHLGVQIDHTGFIMDYKDMNDMHIWLADKHEVPAEVIIPYFDSAHWNSFIEAKEKGISFFANQLDFEEKNKFYADLFELIPGVTNETKEYYQSCPGLAISTVLLENLGLYIENFSGTPYTSEENAILMRFGKVFQQTYTRFLDLQKAEAQAREAQIEAALEKVRSRSLAMHKTEELQEVVSVVFEKLQELEFVMDAGAIIFTFTEGSKDVIQWIANPGQSVANRFVTPFIDHPIPADLWRAKESGKDFFAKVYSFEEKNVFFKAAFELSEYKFFPDEAKKAILACESYSNSVALAKNSAILIPNHSGKLFSEKENDILRRFAKVFEQAYVRFLDLQKAEIQANESRIEAALERVRSRTMGMQRSEELKEVIQVVYEQFVYLGLDIASAGFIMDYKETDDWHLWMADALHSFPNQEHIPYFDHPHWNGFNEVKRKGLDTFVNTLTFDEKNSLFNHISKYIPGTAEGYKLIFSAPGYAVSNILLKNVSLFIDRYSTVPFSETDNAILKRFGKVFEQTYTRFNDLKQAEVQAHEAKIEAALERTRTQSMIMQHSNELDDTLRVFHEQVLHLGLPSAFSFLWLPDENKDRHLFWAVWAEDDSKTFNSKAVDYPLDRTDPATAQCLVDWRGNDPVVAYRVPPDGIESYFAAWQELVGGVETLRPDHFREGLYYVEAFMKYGCFGVMVKNELPEEQKKILARFAVEFERTYTRFLDLQKAEAQARESQIQLALERVRARTMAMHESDELTEVATLLFKQVNDLGIKTWTTGFNVWSDDNNSFVDYITSPQGGFIEPYTVYSSQSNLSKEVSDARKDGVEFLVQYAEGEILKETYRALSKLAKNKQYNKMLKEGGFQFPSHQYDHFVFGSKVSLMFITYEAVPEAHDIFKRFGKVFEQTYTRFLDLQKSEKQAREAQIELSLERVRAKTMAMHNSEHVADTVATMFDELLTLGVDLSMRCGIGIIDETKHMEVWTAFSDQGSGKTGLVTGLLDMTSHQMLNGVFNNWKNKELHSTYMLTGKDQEDYYTALNNSDHYGIKFDIAALPVKQYQNAFYFREGFIYVFTHEQLGAEPVQIYKRFAAVFGLTYRRYLDLKQAEEQAWESKIEAALEKVRGKALAMYSSKDLSVTASMVFTELRKLGISPLRCGVGIMNKDSPKVALYSATNSIDGDGLALVGWVVLSGHPVLEKIYDSLLSGEDYFPVLKGKQLKSYYQKLLSGLSLPSIPDFRQGEEQYGHFFPFPEGCLYAWAEKPYNETDIRIFKRFASVIDLTFRRYIELQKSEAQAREAVRQASLDRVRAEIASMRSVADLGRITPLVWNELTILSIGFIRCGVFIMNEQEQLIHTHLSTADGKALAAFNLPYDSEGIGQNVLPAWRIKQIATIHWSAEEFADFTKNLVEQGTVTSQERYVTEHPDTSLDLHFFPFLQGMLYVGNVIPLTDDEKDLVQSLADAFSTAYARYEDFNRLELAKLEVENTLTDLKTAQTRLIQSEKMASLGELTAGIAHEIQNPLNFVNNFSEVNQEMIDELEQELKAGNIEEALDLAADIKQNEQKINHHGKRADGIVKGMLQHSRTSSNDKSLTNINSVADEYMRLAYHGLRAKDKAFNAEMVMLFDPDLPRVEAIGQDIGRVFINLFNNAFYAVNQKKKTAEPGYNPTVTVSTYVENGQVMIKVADNGTGIPDYIKEKIMQPFFTTKPTGEGTGLGLSLTYDMVVKGHGGTIQVNSVEGEGSEFIISLPLS